MALRKTCLITQETNWSMRKHPHTSNNLVKALQFQNWPMPTIDIGFYINEQRSAEWDSFLHEIGIKSWRKKKQPCVNISVYFQLINCSIHKNCANANQESMSCKNGFRCHFIDLLSVKMSCIVFMKVDGLILG